QALFNVDDWRDAIYAKIVTKVGERAYWENWASDVAGIAERHVARISRLVADPDSEKGRAFTEFLAELRSNINPGLRREDAIDMLAQHLITAPVFDALFGSDEFTRHNPVSVTMDAMLATLDDHALAAETETLEGFYASVRMRAAGIDNHEGRQRIITELYERFFKVALPKTAEAFGIVYTPIEVVDFILRSVDWALREYFDADLSSEGVQVLDPFTGTGTFIVRLLQSGLIRQGDLRRKYREELHANEILLLAYYIAAINIEATFHQVRGEVAGEGSEAGAASAASDGVGTGTGEANTGGAVGAADTDVEGGGAANGDAAANDAYEPFDGIVLTDTFQLTEDPAQTIPEFLQENNKRLERQKALDIRVIIGNPPYSVGQTNANDNNANMKYPALDQRIEATYAAQSTATNKNSLYDSYIRAFRWASDRIGDEGVICFVSNGGWIDGNTADGLRASLADEFTDIFVFNLRGNQRTAGELSRKEGGKVFGSGSRSTVAITMLVKRAVLVGAEADPPGVGDGRPAVGVVASGEEERGDTQRSEPGVQVKADIHYRDIGDYLTREQKLAIVGKSSNDGVGWEQITPNAAGDWLNQRDDAFGGFAPIGDRGSSASGIFAIQSPGIQTNRDAWVYNFSRHRLTENVQGTITFYNHEVNSYADRVRIARAAGADDPEDQAEAHVSTDGECFSWSSGVRSDLRRGVKYRYGEQIRPAAYRPYCSEWLYFDSRLNHRPGKMADFFPTPHHANVGFYLVGVGSDKPFSTLMTSHIPDLAFWGSSNGQYFPRYTYEEVEDDGALFGSLDSATGEPSDVDKYGYRRVDNITDAALSSYRGRYGPQVTKDDIFYYVYGLLHSPEYRIRFAADLKKMLPRIPQVAAFAEFAAAGRALAELHLGYESLEPWPVTITVDGVDYVAGRAADLPPLDEATFDDDVFRVSKMAFAKGAGGKADKST
ncbi:MAG: hypothetical protein QG597_3318, partial [Actinomycetota bacterium]|nr:hypothetical protein [Actinomycetota bacterium]